MIAVEFIPPLATVQDLGRDGYWAQGLGRAGAMDALAHRTANLLLGNPESAATLEIPLCPAQLRFTENCAFALAGADADATLAGRPLPRYFAGVANAGDLLGFGPITQGGRIYLALPGGIDVPEVLASRATQLRESFGGHEGRALRPGDLLKPAAPRATTAPVVLPPPPLKNAGGEIVLYALPSGEHDEFDAQAQADFWGQPWQVTAQSNRQGYRLSGPTLTRDSTTEMRSHGIVPGIVQVPAGGQPIIQLADSATMGGYPKIACVIEADLWKLGQARPGDSLRFERTDLAGAAQAEADLRRDLDDLAARLARHRTLTRSW